MSAFQETFVEHEADLEDYEDSEILENDFDLDLEVDELDLSPQEIEAEEEIGQRSRIPVRPPPRKRPQPARSQRPRPLPPRAPRPRPRPPRSQRARPLPPRSQRPGPQPAAGPPPAYRPKPPRGIRRHPRSVFVDEPVTCSCPEPTCPEHGTEYIRWVQNALNDVLGLRLPVNGIMGSETRSAVRSFQEREGLPVTGIIGPDIASALIAARGGKSPGAEATKPGEPGMTEPSEPAATPSERGMTEPVEPASTSPAAAEFDFEWESFNPGATQDEAAARQDQIAFEAELGVGDTPFGETFFEAEHESAPSDVQAFAVALGAEWSKRRNGDPSPDAITAWLLKDYQDTLDGARRRWGKKFGAGQFTVEALGHAWKISRTENMKFQGGSLGAKALVKFDPPAENVALVTSPLIEDSDKAPVAPLLVKFVEELRRRHSGFVRASNYRGHGGGKFDNRGHSLDLFIKGLDDRGFYPKDGAVKLLRAVHEAASAVGAQWRVIYNDFQVADVVNRALGRRHVIFVGSTRKTGNTVTGLNWHGPAPLILHFHLDLAPLAGGSPSSWKGAPSVLELKDNIGRIAKREWERWGRGAKHETDPGMRRALRDYWQAGGRSAKDAEQAIDKGSPWSAAFVSYVMKEAGAGDAFRRSGAHRVYVTAAKRAFKQGDASKFWSYDITKVKPEVGDLVCRDRSPRPAGPCGGSTYDNVDDGRERATHCDIVTEVAPGFIMVIGGNTSGPACPRGGCTVGVKKIKLDTRGFVIPDQSTCKYFAVVKPPVRGRE